MDRLDEVVQELRSVTAPPPTPQQVRRRRLPRPLIFALPAAVVGMVLAVTLLHRAPEPPVQRIAKPVGQWQRIMERIDENRMRAFMDDDVGSLIYAEVFNSPAHRQDMVIMTELRSRHLRLDRNPLRIDAVEEEFLALAGEVKRAGLLVTDHLDAYNYLDKNGTVVASTPERATKQWRIELRRSAPLDRWLLFSAEPATPRSAEVTPRGM